MWFAANARDLPWRRTRDPYAILVSEVMLQQTQVDRVVPRYLAWLERWPTVESLAEATTGDVIREWQGLGYNRRAVNLHRAAQIVARDGWPADLTTLPGVGPYTAAAVRCFAFGEDVLPVDVNVERVQRRTGCAFSPGTAQALMDLGATICLARVPRCDCMPSRSGVPVARDPRGAGAQAGSFRGLVPPAPRSGATARRRCTSRARRARRRQPFARSKRDGLVSSRREWSGSRRSSTLASRPIRRCRARRGAAPRRSARRACRCRPRRPGSPDSRERRTHRRPGTPSPSTRPTRRLSRG